jgi:hypothetical protein
MLGSMSSAQKIFYSIYDNKQKKYILQNRIFDGNPIKIDNYNIPSNYSFLERRCEQGGTARISAYTFTVMGIMAGTSKTTLAIPFYIAIDENLCADDDGGYFQKHFFHTSVMDGGFSLTGNSKLLEASSLGVNWNGGGASSAWKVSDGHGSYWDYGNPRPNQYVSYEVNLSIPLNLHNQYISTDITKINTLNKSLPGKIN